MSLPTTEISVKGRKVEVRTAKVLGHDLVVQGRWPRVASVFDEEWTESLHGLNPQALADAAARSTLNADLLTVSGALNQPVRANITALMDNVAVIHTADLKGWWEALPQEARKNTRRAAKRGVSIRPVVLDREMAAGIKRIYDEAPVRQGRTFWHYGKDVETIFRENSSYLDRSTFLGAYFEGELIGFMKWVRVESDARIMQILCMNSHQDKRPVIALIASAAEICHQQGARYLIYGKYTYGRKVDSSIAEFKKRLGFAQLDLPRYFLPLTRSGQMAMRLGLHRDLRDLLPPAVVQQLSALRSRFMKRSTSTGSA